MRWSHPGPHISPYFSYHSAPNRETHKWWFVELKIYKIESAQFLMHSRSHRDEWQILQLWFRQARDEGKRQRTSRVRFPHHWNHLNKTYQVKGRDMKPATITVSIVLTEPPIATWSYNIKGTFFNPTRQNVEESIQPGAPHLPCLFPSIRKSHASF